jgi:hypothetical protein
MPDRNPFTNTELSSLLLGMLVLSLEDFAATLIAASNLSDDALAEIRRQAIVDLENSAAAGLSIEQESEIFRDAVRDLEQLIDNALARGRQGRNARLRAIAGMAGRTGRRER